MWGKGGGEDGVGGGGESGDGDDGVGCDDGNVVVMGEDSVGGVRVVGRTVWVEVVNLVMVKVMKLVRLMRWL